MAFTVVTYAVQNQSSFRGKKRELWVCFDFKENIILKVLRNFFFQFGSS